MMEFLDAVDSILYYPILLVVMGAAGLYFSIRMGFVQVRWLPEAIRLLKDSSMKVYEIAEAVGYRDIAYFSATFKRITGHSPSEYLK